MNINWYPGHMKKTYDILQQKLKVVDLVIELLDARIPFSSSNPNISALTGNKPRVVVLNKEDLADTETTKRWIKWFADRNINAIAVNSTIGGIKDTVRRQIELVCREKIQKYKRQGRITYKLRAMVVGIPNVGKSMFINNIAGRKIAKTGNKPGVTKAKQWIKIGDTIELMDTPGVLWPKIEEQNVARRLAYVGSIKDELLNMEELAKDFLEEVGRIAPQIIRERYGIKNLALDGYKQLEEICENRGFIKQGGQPDLYRAAVMILDEYRKKKLGRISLESP
ncbi:MAG TPA: ribosome biogenesis GTPase YlqF [Clostridiales bacterium]|nr:ribosome biogenesis GTPase YlqF [Clostridiales bacterium]